MNLSVSVPFVLHAIAPEHLSAVLTLDRLCFGQLWSLDAYQRELDSPNSELLGISWGEELVGLGCYWAIVEEAHLTILAIHPQYQNRGLGQFLLCALLDSARKRGLERATLEVKASNHTALGLYQKFGFLTAGRRRNYYQETGEDALVLWLNHLQSPQFPDRLIQWQQQAQEKWGE
jgi:ribosomal-protein-alanine N-acetyltransferase